MNEDPADLDRSRAGVPHTALALIIFPQFDFRSVNRLFFFRTISLRYGGVAASSRSTDGGSGRIPSNCEDFVDTTAGQAKTDFTT